jgi:Spy/CpxP family protein refolding chaperone
MQLRTSTVRRGHGYDRDVRGMVPASGRSPVTRRARLAPAKEVDMFLSHRAWRHAYATGYWHRACLDRASEAKRSNQMLSWSSGPMFGVRRPLRHLAWKLNLNEEQVRALVDILDRLKTGYGQARLDRQRSTSDVAAAFTAETLDEAQLNAALESRTRATEALNRELSGALKALYALLNPEQRREFAYLLRSGSFVL